VSVGKLSGLRKIFGRRANADTRPVDFYLIGWIEGFVGFCLRGKNCFAGLFDCGGRLRHSFSLNAILRGGELITFSVLFRWGRIEKGPNSRPDAKNQVRTGFSRARLFAGPTWLRSLPDGKPVD